VKFQNLNSKLQRLDKRERQEKKKSKRKLFFRVLIVLIVATLTIYLPIRGVYSAVRKLMVNGKALSVAVKNEDLDGIRSDLKVIHSNIGQLKTSLSFLFWVRVLPFVGDYYADANHFASAAGNEIQAALTITDWLDPYKTELGLTGHPTPGQDRITQAIKILDKAIPNLDSIEPQLAKASVEVEHIDVAKYPASLGHTAVRSRVEIIKNLIIGANYVVTKARPALKIAPSALGEPSPKNYLIIFQNDKELRATGGFMTAYAFMSLDKGRISSSKSDDIYRLDERLLKVCLNVICPLTPPAPIVKYLPEENGKARTAWSMRDSNLSPDLQTSLKTFEKMYSFLKEDPFDGIITIDTQVVEELIRITGPIDVFGTTYSAETDKRCNCPNVIYELENYAQIIEKGEADRKAILGTLMQQILARSLGASTDKLPEFINAGVKLANAKHIMFYMHDSPTQQALSALNWTGEIKQTDRDYLHVNDSNFAGGKSNIYVTVDGLLEIDTNGADIKHKLTLNYKNPEPYKTWLNGINRDYVRVYVPKGARLSLSKGSEEKVTTIEDDLGKTVFEAFIQIRPQNSLTLTFEYTTPKGALGRDYPLLIQKQPGTHDYKYVVKINGKEKANFELSSDMDLKLPL